MSPESPPSGVAAQAAIATALRLQQRAASAAKAARRVTIDVRNPGCRHQPFPAKVAHC